MTDIKVKKNDLVLQGLESVFEALEKEEVFSLTEPIKEFSLNYANYLLGQIATAQKEIDRNKSFVDEEIQKIRDWQLKREKIIGSKIEFANETLEAFARPYMEDNNKKTEKLPAGELQLRKKPLSVKIESEQQALVYCKTNDIETKKKEYCSKTNIKKYYESTNELADGCSLGGGEIIFKTKIKSEDIKTN